MILSVALSRLDAIGAFAGLFVVLFLVSLAWLHFGNGDRDRQRREWDAQVLRDAVEAQRRKAEEATKRTRGDR